MNCAQDKLDKGTKGTISGIDTFILAQGTSLPFLVLKQSRPSGSMTSDKVDFSTFIIVGVQNFKPAEL